METFKTFSTAHLRGTVDVLTGGFPCQPFSLAGQRKGKGDDRYLWPQMLRVIGEVKPRWIVGENVAGIVNLALHDIIPACAVNAPHRRDRVWIVAYANGVRLEKHELQQSAIREQLGETWSYRTEGIRKNTNQLSGGHHQRHDWEEFRVDRIKSLGNAIVPQVAFEIFKAIERINM